nr:methylmalonyl-CoA mutase subunit beta [Neobacillus sp. Marseille-Q6967]
MSLEELKNQSFSPISNSEWVEKAEASLKGKKIETLKSNTYEDITLKPLYTEEDEQTVPSYPGGSDFRRGVYPLGYISNNWRIAQNIYFKSNKELKDKLSDALGRGQNAISFDVTTELLEDKETLNEIIENLSISYPFALNAKGLQFSFLSELTRIIENSGNGDKITGYIASDPVSMFAEEGLISNDFLSKWSVNIKQMKEKLPNLRTVLVNTSSFHQGGANAVQELGIAAATGVFYLQQLAEQGMGLKVILSSILFNFSIGSNYFMEVAKLRAARIIWNKITEVYGAGVEERGMHIAAETSSFTKTVYDPHVNILRAGSEAFAAVTGGIQYLHVTPFDRITGSSELGERIARNTQNILQQEAHLQKVVDPAGGSWYIESLTSELAEKAWSYFQQIEAKGGILEVLKSNWLQNEINTVNEKRKSDIFNRKQSIVGMNVYANLDEKISNIIVNKTDNYLSKPESASKIRPIPKLRLSESFENLRRISENLERKSGQKPHVGMICLGELKQHKPRLDFMRSFLSAGGLQAIESGSIHSYENAKQFVSQMETKYFCLCGTNEQYETIGHELLSSLKDAFNDRIFYLAGLPEKETQAQWISEGIKQFIHIKSNCYEILSSILSEMEVAVNEVTKA